MNRYYKESGRGTVRYDRAHRQTRVLSRIHQTGHRVSSPLCRTVAVETAIYDRGGRWPRRDPLYARGLRDFPSALRRTFDFTGIQLILGSPLDVHELRIHQFHMDLAVAVEGCALFSWSFLILLWWFVCPQLAATFSPADGAQIVIERPTGAYHGYMALLLFVGYLGVILYNLWQGRPECRVSIPWILAIGVLVQFGWEAGLLIGRIRSAGFPSLAEKLRPLIVNSLLETNLGMPYMYLIFIAYSSRFTEDLHRRKTPLALVERIAEYNGGKNA